MFFYTYRNIYPILIFQKNTTKRVILFVGIDFNNLKKRFLRAISSKYRTFLLKIKTHF